MKLDTLKLTATQDVEKTLSYIVGGSFLIALCAQIQIPLGFTPVPITLQTLAVLMLAAMLGARNAMLAVIVYLAEGMMGFPVMKGGTINSLALIGPTGGYLLGMVAQAYLAGWFFERAQRFSSAVLFLAVSATCFIGLGLGAVWLSFFVGTTNTLHMGVLPFIPGEIVKTLAVIGYSSSMKR